jgi:hypothetical protein
MGMEGALNTSFFVGEVMNYSSKIDTDHDLRLLINKHDRYGYLFPKCSKDRSDDRLTYAL